MSDTPSPPPLTDEAELAKLWRNNAVEEYKAEQAAKRDFDKLYFQTIVDTGKASIDRSRSAGQLVQGAAAAIGTIYTTVLGVAFSVAERPIPARALLPVLFLGLAIVGSMVYLAFPTGGTAIDGAPPTTSRPERMYQETDRYLRLVNELVGRRVRFLRASVIALGVAVVVLPAPFINDTVQAQADAKAAAAGTTESTTTTASTVVSLPEPPPVASDAEAVVEAIRYQAQVDRALEASSPKSAAQEAWPWWANVALVAGLLAVAMPWVRRRVRTTRQQAAAEAQPGFIVMKQR